MKNTLSQPKLLKCLASICAIFLVSAGQLSAQYFSFGQNRVQYKNFEWRFIQSQHFDVYYYTSKNYDIANYAAISLEASLKQLEQDFDHKIADRISVIVYDSHNDFAQTNVVSLPVGAGGIGGVTDPFKNRITMPFSGDYTEFRSTLQHELVHAVINDMFYGGNVQSIISGSNQLQIPLWMNEGLAEYESKGWDTVTDMWMRDGTINDYLPPLKYLSGYIAYRVGEAMWNFVVEQYGREKISEIMQTMKSQRSVEAAFKRSLGLSVDELSSKMRDFYRKRYLPEVADREKIADLSSQLTKRDNAGTYNTSPAVSPQGDKIAMITNRRGYLDVVVINAITGKRLKTLIKGSTNTNFEDYNLLNPSLTWSPDGSKIALSAKSGGQDELGIIDYESGKVQKIRFPKLDAIGSVAWSPDGDKIAFDAHSGPFQDIFVYNLKTRSFSNITNDVISDFDPAWSEDSKTIYFSSARGDNTQLGVVKNNEDLLAGNYIYSTDIYSVEIGSNRAVRLTKTPLWDETQVSTTRAGKLAYISDQNGIPNVYEFNLSDRTSKPLTNLQTGVMQMSISADGSRLAVNSINQGYLDIYIIRSPFTQAKSGPLKPNYWAQRRERETEEERVPATGYVQQMLAGPGLGITSTPQKADTSFAVAQQKAAVQRPDSVTTDTTKKDESIDFRNYVFAKEVEEDTTFAKKYLNKSKFELSDNRTKDGRYIPQDYRLKFSVDFAYGGGGFSTYYGSYGLTQIVFSDLLGNHQVAFGSNLVFDLRNSNYFLQYSYLKHRTNLMFNFFHSAIQYQTFSGQLIRFRNLGGGINAQYPLDRFRRFDFGISAINVAQDYSVLGVDQSQNESTTFLYPQIIYTKDNTLAGFITPIAGSRYSVSLSASPPLSNNTLQFVSALADYRKYFNLGRQYSFAVRGSGAASFGRDSQTFFMGGMLGWINQRWSGNSLPIDRLGENFFTLPALPLRGHEFNSIYGDRFALFNAEFRFPLFAAILPGPIPILPLYNLTGVAFVDAGMAWGQTIPYKVSFTNGNEYVYGRNSSRLDFKVRKDETKYLELNSDGSVHFENGKPVVVDNKQAGTNYESLPDNQGDILIGAGFGLRTILLGFPLRYDIGWPYYRGGFKGKPINYISIGIDF